MRAPAQGSSKQIATSPFPESLPVAAILSNGFSPRRSFLDGSNVPGVQASKYSWAGGTSPTLRLVTGEGTWHRVSGALALRMPCWAAWVSETRGELVADLSGPFQP